MELRAPTQIPDEVLLPSEDRSAAACSLTDPGAALRRVARLVAEDVPSSELFQAVVREVGALFDADFSGMIRYDDGTVTAVATWAALGEHPPVPAHWCTVPDDPAIAVAAAGAPVRVDNWGSVPGPIASFVRGLRVTSSVGCPILVAGRLWGALAVHSKQRAPLPADTESRLLNFTELVAGAIANTNARAEAERLAEEQAALRRGATLAAGGGSPTAVFDAVAGEMEALLDADGMMLARYEPSDEFTVVADRQATRMLPGTRWNHEGENVASTVRRTGRPARIEDYARKRGALARVIHSSGVRAAVGVPIVVEGSLWGVALARWNSEASTSPGTEARMAQFAELLGTAIANADSRAKLKASRARLLTEGDLARRRVVRDLHDGAQQRLVHAIITLKRAQRALQLDDGSLNPLLNDALEQAERANEELRELAHGILPSVLTQRGLRAGVNTVVDRLAMRVDVDLPGERFPPEVEASAYFVVAETLTNVMKHSHARHAEVTARAEDGVLVVQIRDNGIGGANADGHGLVGLGDRVAALGGRLKVDSPPGRGTVVRAPLPLARHPA